MHEIDYKINVNVVYFVNWKGGLPLCLQSRASSTRQLRARLDPHRSSFKILSALKHLNWPHKEFTAERLNRSRTFINPFIALSASNNLNVKVFISPLSEKISQQFPMKSSLISKLKRSESAGEGPLASCWTSH